MNADPNSYHHSADTLSDTADRTISIQAISRAKPWRDMLFDLPDDGGECLACLVAKIPHLRSHLTLQPYGGYRLRLADQGTHIVMVMAVPELRALGSLPFLEANELFVPFEHRADGDAALAANGGIGRWTELECVSGTDAALKAFEELWTADVLPLL